MRLPFLMIVLALWACDGAPVAVPSPSTEIVVISPSANNEYLIGDTIRIKWSEIGTVGPVDIALRPADANLPQWILFEMITGGEVIWRDWWERHESILTGHYVIMIGTPNRQPFVNATSAVFFLNRTSAVETA